MPLEVIIQNPVTGSPSGPIKVFGGSSGFRQLPVADEEAPDVLLDVPDGPALAVEALCFALASPPSAVA